MEVKKHVILYLDILGYKNLILGCKSKAGENVYLQKIYSLMATLSDHIERRNAIVDERCDKRFPLNLSRFKYCLFSDNILFFAPYEDETDADNLYLNMLYGLSEFMIQYERDDLFFRGAITKGELYFDEKAHFVFGSGLIRAHEMESRSAIYPRIVIDDSFNPSPIFAGIVKDEYGVWYFDYLLLGYSLLCGKDGNENIAYFSQCLAYHQRTIIEALEKYRYSLRIWKKYKWLAIYHNGFCKRMDFEKYFVKWKKRVIK